MRRLLPKLMAVITRHDRYLVERGVDFEWSDKSWTHNIFRLYELIFGRRFGIRAEVSSFIDAEGNTVQAAHSWEAACALVETTIRQLLSLRVPMRIWVPILQTPQGIPVFASPYLFAIALDTSTQGTRTTNAVQTWAHTMTGSNLIAILGVCVQQNTVDVLSAASYNSVSMFPVDLSELSGNANEGDDYLLHQFSPTTGANNFSCTQSVAGTFAMVCMAASYSGASQTGFPDASVLSGKPISTNLTMTVTIVAANSWGLVFDSNRAGDPTAGTNTTQRQNGTGTGPFLGDSNGAKPSGSFSMTTNHTSTTWCGMMVSFAPAGAATESPKAITSDIIIFN